MKTNIKSPDYSDFLDDLSGYYRDKESADEAAPIGGRIKKMRDLERLSIEQLSSLSGIDRGVLEKIESREIYPDLGMIIKLSKALRITTGLLLGGESGYSYSVVKKEDRKKIARHPAGTKERENYVYQSLAAGVKDRHMETFIVTLAPAMDETELSSHDGEEFLMVLEGKIKVILGKKEEILSEGDSIYYLSTIPHLVKNDLPDRNAVILAALYAG